MTPYGAELAYRNRVLSGKAPWSRAMMATLFYWCVLGTILVSAPVARADIEFYPDERPGSSIGPQASRTPSSRLMPQADGSDVSEIAPPSSLDNDESTQRLFPFNLAVPMSYDQRKSADMMRYTQTEMEQLKEIRRLQDEEAMRQQMHEEEILQRMMLQAAQLGELRRRLKSDQDGFQRMQVRHRGNYPESSMEKPVPIQSQPSPYIYADSRLKDIFSPLSNHRHLGALPAPPSLRDLAGMTDEKMADGDLSMDRGVDSLDAGSDVQHIIPYYGSAVPMGLQPTHMGAGMPKYPSPAAALPVPTPPPTPPPRSKSRSSFYGSNIIQMEDGTVAKKVLRMPDHWFLGMPDVYKLAIVIGCSVMGAGVVIGGLIWQYRLHRRAKAAADVDYPAYGVTGPSRDLSSPSGDRRLAQSAQIYHYQHQKQQILSMEGGNQPPSRGSMSEAESEDENEEGDYTVYECPGLAPPGEMEVKNPMFDDDPTTATPATPATPGSTTVGRDEGRSKNNKGSPSSK